MDKAQELLQKIHTEFGLSDLFIAKLLDPPASREHINRVKQGKLVASQRLTNDLAELLQGLREISYHPDRKPYTWQAGTDPRGKQHKPPVLNVHNYGQSHTSTPVPTLPIGPVEHTPPHTTVVPLATLAPRPQKQAIAIPSLPGMNLTEKWNYTKGMLCRVCLSPGQARSYDVPMHGSMRLCEQCAAKYIPENTTPANPGFISYTSIDEDW